MPCLTLTCAATACCAAESGTARRRCTGIVESGVRLGALPELPMNTQRPPRIAATLRVLQLRAGGLCAPHTP